MDDIKPAEPRAADPTTRLFRTYDPLLGETPPILTPDETEALTGLARIYDLDAEAAPAQVWRAVRQVLAGQAAAETAAPAPGPLTILVAEDDAETAADVVEVLTEAGHRVIGPFQEAETAILSAGLHDLDLALLDVNLAGEESGVDLARRLQKNWGVPSVLLSGDVTAVARHASETVGLVLKPYSARQVLNAVAAAARIRTQPRSATLI